MEPMNLGSPVGSSATTPPSFPAPNVAGISSPAVTNSFYPSYLMGESPSYLSSRIPAGSVSPGRRGRQFSSSTPLSPQSPYSSKDKSFQTQRISGEKQVGPPNFGLLGGLAQSPAGRLQNSAFVEQQKIIGTSTSMCGQSPARFNGSLHASQIEEQLTPSFTPVKEMLYTSYSEQPCDISRVEILENTWVTIYGFPVASASYILTQFAQIGPIVEHRLPGLGNWMHVKYQTKLQARKALSKNGKVFNGNIMIGVISCTDQTLVSDKENNTNLNSSSLAIFSPYSPRNTPKKGHETTPKTHMRPLTQAYHAARAEIEVTPTSNTPKKNEGLVSRAIQHLLGI